MSQYKVKNYEGYQEVLDSVRSIVTRIAPEWAASAINKEIDAQQEEIEETLSGRADMAEEMESKDEWTAYNKYCCGIQTLERRRSQFCFKDT